MAIKLLKPLGTDIYDIDVFNYNATTIETYLNKLVAGDEISLKVYYYPKDSTTFNIDTCLSGVHICDNMLFDNISGAFPDESSKSNFEVMSLGSEPGNSTVQLLFDLSNNNKYITYFRAKLPNSDDWSSWVKIATGSGSTSEGVQIIYTDEIDIDEVGTGIYMCKDATVTGVMPAELIDKSLFQLISYGDDDNGPKSQTLIDLKHEPGTQYTRYKRQLPNGEWAWTKWEKQKDYDQFKDEFIAKNNGTGTGTTKLENLETDGLKVYNDDTYFGSEPTEIGIENAKSRFWIGLNKTGSVNNTIYSGFGLQSIIKNNTGLQQNFDLRFGVVYSKDSKNPIYAYIHTITDDLKLKLDRPQTDSEAVYDADIPNLGSIKKLISSQLSTLISSVTQDINMNGNKITNLAEPEEDNDAVTKYYADNNPNFVKKSGDEITGSLLFKYQKNYLGFVNDLDNLKIVSKTNVSGDTYNEITIDFISTIVQNNKTYLKLTNIATPENDFDAANKKFVEDTVAASGGGGNYLPLSGGTLTGELNMDSNRIINVSTPLDDFDAANKKFVEDTVTSISGAVFKLVDL